MNKTLLCLFNSYEHNNNNIYNNRSAKKKEEEKTEIELSPNPPALSPCLS